MLGIALLLGASVYAQVRSIELPGDNAMAELKPGPGVEVARANCVACHSTDYIVRQPGSDAKRWEGEVKKMISVYGAPIDEVDAKVIVQYLATAYGPAKTNPTKEKKTAK
jgi:mono/diheme cytochrome c family protein